MVLEVTFSGQKLGSKGKRQWVRGPFQVFLFKTTFCSSWEFASMCHIICSGRLSSAEGLVTWWVLVWGCVETEELCIAVSLAGQCFLKQMVTTLEQPAGLCLAGTCSFWLCQWLLASAFPSVGEREWYALCNLFLQHSTWDQVLPDRGGNWTRRRYFAFKMRGQWEKEGGPQASCTQWIYGGACLSYNIYPVSPEYWWCALSSAEDCGLVFWPFPPPLPQDFLGLYQCCHL